MQPFKPIGLGKWRRVLVSPAAESSLPKDTPLIHLHLDGCTLGDVPYTQYDKWRRVLVSQLLSFNQLDPISSRELRSHDSDSEMGLRRV